MPNGHGKKGHHIFCWLRFKGDPSPKKGKKGTTGQRSCLRKSHWKGFLVLRDSCSCTPFRGLQQATWQATGTATASLNHLIPNRCLLDSTWSEILGMADRGVGDAFSGIHALSGCKFILFPNGNKESLRDHGGNSRDTKWVSSSV